MTGGNCCIPGCSTSRRLKYSGIALFKLPNRPIDKEWRKQLITEISRYRELDTKFREQIERDTVKICEDHFQDNDIEYTKLGRKSLRLGALPSINLPSKSCETQKPPPRRILEREVNQQSELNQEVIVYKHFEDLKAKVAKLKLNGWIIKNSYINKTLALEHFSQDYTVPKFKVIVTDELNFSCFMLGWKVQSKCFDEHNQSLKYISMYTFLKELLSYKICDGVNTEDITLKSASFKEHIVPCQEDLSASTEPITYKKYYRSNLCEVLINDIDVNIKSCSECINVFKKAPRNSKIQTKKNKIPAHKNAPLSNTNPERVRLALKQERLQCNDLKQNLKKMEWEIQNKGVDIDQELVTEIHKTFADNEKNITPFMKLFWAERKKHLERGLSKYHPMIIWFCLSLASKSSSTYDELRDSRVLVLPSRRTLREYKNFVKPQVGFNKDVINELCKKTAHLTSYQRYFSLLIDEMKISENLVYNKYTEELISYVDLGDEDLNSMSFSNVNDLATHVMVYYVRGIANDIKFNFAYFATKGITAVQIFSNFWDAIAILELNCNLKILAVVSDGASPNRTFYRIHKYLQLEEPAIYNSTVVHKTLNLFADEPRYIY